MIRPTSHINPSEPKRMRLASSDAVTAMTNTTSATGTSSSSNNNNNVVPGIGSSTHNHAVPASPPTLSNPQNNTRPWSPRSNAASSSDPLEMLNFRKVSGAKCSDYYCSILQYVTQRAFFHPRHTWVLPPHPSYSKEMLPAPFLTQNPTTAICTQWINTVYNYDAKQRSETGGINRKAQLTKLIWTRGGRRLIAASSQGDFILWNGHSYNIESRTIAHEDTACRALSYAPINDLLLSGHDRGVVRIWHANLTCVRRVEAHPTGGSVIRDIALSPSEHKFVTCGKDGTARMWATDACVLETKMEGHGGDITSASWHPHQALLATGSIDREIRLWDIRTVGSTGTSSHVETLQQHSAGVTCVRFNPHVEHELLTAGKDARIYLWDLRSTNQPSAVFHGHTRDVHAVQWHPHHRSLFLSTGADGTLAFWIVGYGDSTLRMEGKELVNRWVAAVPKAHGEFRGQPVSMVDVAWHPLGHVVATSSWDVRLWARNKPGTEAEIRYNDQLDTAYEIGTTAEKARQLARAAVTGTWNPDASRNHAREGAREVHSGGQASASASHEMPSYAGSTISGSGRPNAASASSGGSSVTKTGLQTSAGGGSSLFVSFGE